MSIKEQDLHDANVVTETIDILVNGVAELLAQEEEVELYRLQQLREDEVVTYQDMLDMGFGNEEAFQQLMNTREPEPEPIETTIKRKLTAVHYLRQAKTALMDDLAERKFDFDEKNKDLLDDIAKQGALLINAESELREIAIYCFDGKNKKPFPGCGIRVSVKETPIYNPAEALDWAKTKDICLQLDVKGFEQICTTILKPEFVQIEEVESVSVAIDTNLIKALTALGVEIVTINIADQADDLPEAS